MQVALLDGPFQPGDCLDRFTKKAQGAGGIASFTGVVRDHDQGGLVALELEHYPGMTEKRLHEIAEQAKSRFGLIDALILHRVGRMALGEPIMMVAAAAAHRGEAFQGAMFMMDYLKSRAPFWKKEHFADGRSSWVQARQSDEDALGGWQ